MKASERMISLDFAYSITAASGIQIAALMSSSDILRDLDVLAGLYGTSE